MISAPVLWDWNPQSILLDFWESQKESKAQSTGLRYALENVENEHFEPPKSWQVFVTFLGWLSNPFKGCW